MDTQVCAVVDDELRVALAGLRDRQGQSWLRSSDPLDALAELAPTARGEQPARCATLIEPLADGGYGVVVDAEPVPRGGLAGLTVRRRDGDVVKQ